MQNTQFAGKKFKLLAPWLDERMRRLWLTVPVKLSSHAHRRRARLFVPKSSLRWWRLFLQEHYPKRKPGRPARAEVILDES